MKTPRRDFPYVLGGPAARPGAGPPRGEVADLEPSARERVPLVAGDDDAAPGPVTGFATGASWSTRLRRHGAVAVDGAAGDLAAVTDINELPVNLLSTMGRLVSRRLRREVLLETLEECGWNLAAAGERLGMGRRADGVVQALRDLGLGDLYDQMRRDGVVRHGGPRARRRKEPVKP